MTRIESLKNRVAVVTGGASGIGRGIAEALIAEGVTVVVADIDEQGAEATAAEIGATARRVDVTDPESVSALAEWVTTTFDRVDILVNNAGVGPLSSFDELTLADFKWVLDINLWGVIHGLKAFLPLLKANPEGGYVVNTASVAGVLPSPGTSAYGASKAAIISLTDSIAAELGPESPIGLATLLPALVRSNIQANALKRPGYDPAAAQTEEFLIESRVLEAREVGDMVVNGIREGKRYIFTHPEVREAIAQYQASILADIA